MNRLKLIALNSQYIHSSLSVISIERMYNYYSELFGYSMPELDTLQLSVNDSFDSLIYRIMPESDIYAFSVYIWNVSLVSEICSYLRKAKPGCIIILGGPEVSYGCNIDCSYVISGEGERSFFSLICKLNGYSVPEFFGFSVNGNVAACTDVSDFSDYLFPYTVENINSFSDRIVYYESSRGCPFSCSYCLSSVCGRVRSLPLERVFSDIDFFVSNSVSQVKFVDRTFNFDKKRAFDIWKYIIESASGRDINFHFEIGADLLDDRCINLLNTAPSGLIQIEAGIQSTYLPALEKACRTADNNKIFNNLSKLVSSGNINVHTDLIAGLPLENYETFKNSFNEVYFLRSHQFQLGFLKLLRGAPLNNDISVHGFVFSTYPPYEIIKNNYISTDELLILKKVEECLERFFNSGRFSVSLDKLLSYFDSPFEMYYALASEAEKSGLLFRSVNSKKLYDFLSAFAENIGTDCDCELLLDFFLSEKTEIVPQRLKYLTRHYKAGSPAAKGNKSAAFRVVGDKLYVIDYSCKNKVTGRFELIKVENYVS